jgi:hypothetical protein
MISEAPKRCDDIRLKLLKSFSSFGKFLYGLSRSSSNSTFAKSDHSTIRRDETDRFHDRGTEDPRPRPANQQIFNTFSSLHNPLTELLRDDII